MVGPIIPGRERVGVNCGGKGVVGRAQTPYVKAAPQFATARSDDNAIAAKIHFICTWRSVDGDALWRRRLGRTRATRSQRIAM